MKFIYRTQILILLGITVGLFNLTNCSTSLEAGTDNMEATQSISEESIEKFPIEELNDGEKDGLIFMREEEKLARDVYITLNDFWNRRVFKNISGSEQRHMNAIKILLDRYEIDDPVGIDSLGIFKNETLQDLYNSLTEEGSSSISEALEVGALIEEIDILDLQAEIDHHVDNQDIIFVYQNLLKGSRNHLRAFVRNLLRQSIEYTPQKLSEDQYQSIINSEWERGRY